MQGLQGEREGVVFEELLSRAGACLQATFHWVNPQPVTTWSLVFSFSSSFRHLQNHLQSL